MLTAYRSIITLLILLLCSESYADTVSRGPYLQRISPSSAIVRWRSLGASDSVVLYGSTQGSLNNRAEVGESTTEHRVEITGLTAGTKYFYSIGSSAERLTLDDGSYYFVTNPSTAQNTRIWVLGDSGRGNADAASVRNSYLNFIQSDGRKADLWLMLGDNAYNNGLDNEYQTGLFDIYPEILKNTVLWPTLGNHDGMAKNFVVGEIPYYASFSLPKNGEVGGVASGTESYYSFNYGDIHFICLNSYDEPRAGSGAMATWLTADLAASTQKWTIAFWHHPPYSKGTHDSDTEIELIEMREQILPLLEGAGVDLVLTGHSHNYERSFLIDGHYGSSATFNTTSVMKRDGTSGENGYNKPPQKTAHKGAVYVVNGTGSLVGGGTLNHPAFYTTKSVLGSMILDIGTDAIEAKFINATSNVEDFFTIRKALQIQGPIAQSSTIAKLSGKLDSLTISDTKYQSLAPKRDSKLGKYIAKNTYRFSLSGGFSQVWLNYRAFKNTATTPDSTISYSTDGKTFKRLGSIRSTNKNITPSKLALEGASEGQVFIRVQSVATSRASSSQSKILIDQLALSNS